MMSSPAPAVKPITTVCEMKLTSAPRRAIPIPNCSADQQRECQDELDVGFGARCRQGRHRGEHDERDRVGRARHLMP